METPEPEATPGSFPDCAATMNGRRQRVVFFVLLGVNVLLITLMFVLALHESMMAGQPMPVGLEGVPAWGLRLANVGFVLVVYGLLGLAGCCGSRVTWPGTGTLTRLRRESSAPISSIPCSLDPTIP